MVFFVNSAISLRTWCLTSALGKINFATDIISVFLKYFNQFYMKICKHLPFYMTVRLNYLKKFCWENTYPKFNLSLALLLLNCLNYYFMNIINKMLIRCQNTATFNFERKNLHKSMKSCRFIWGCHLGILQSLTLLS